MPEHKQKENDGCVTVDYSTDEKKELYDAKATDVTDSPSFRRLIERFKED